MSLALAFGIVAVINLAVGYALALYLEADARTIDSTPPPSQAGGNVTPDPGAEALLPEDAALLSEQPTSGAAAEKNTRWSEQFRRDRARADQAHDDAAANAGVPQASRQAGSAPQFSGGTEVRNLPQASDELLEGTQRLLEDAEDEPAAKPPALEPRATLADAAHLEAAIRDWWKVHTEEPLCVAQIEIDNLRQLSAEFDPALIGSLAQQIEAQVLHTLRYDDLVASLGRARFLAVFPGAMGDVAAELLDDLRRRLASTNFVHNGREIRATLTAGVAQANGPEPLEAFLARAAEALSFARGEGRNRVSWTDGTQTTTLSADLGAVTSQRIML